MSLSQMRKNIQQYLKEMPKVTQGKSWIVAKKFVVYLDKKNNTKKYEAIGNVRFEID